MGSKERTVKSPKTEINGKAVKPAYSRWLFKNIVVFIKGRHGFAAYL